MDAAKSREPLLDTAGPIPAKGPLRGGYPPTFKSHRGPGRRVHPPTCEHFAPTAAGPAALPRLYFLNPTTKLRPCPSLPAHNVLDCLAGPRIASARENKAAR
jgi:hypothetical protein